jgi:uncharacterized protein YbjT (DUF2867 family)
MKILITGATGFIGTYLVKALSDQGHSIRCLARNASRVGSLRAIGVDICYGDLTVKDSLMSLVDGIDVIYYLAGEVYSKKKKDYYEANILATSNLREVAE